MLNNDTSKNKTNAYFLSPPILNGTDNVEDVFRYLKNLEITPYIYIYHSFKHLINGDYDEAFKHLESAGKFEGIFYKKGTPENLNYSNTIMLLQYMMLHLADEFKQFRSHIDKENMSSLK